MDIYKTADTIQTHTGLPFNFRDPKPWMVSLADVAWHLAGCNRYACATLQTFSTAQHSVLVSYLVDRTNALAGLMHDGHEAYSHDITSPMKNALRDLIGARLRLVMQHDFPRALKGFDPLREFEHSIQDVVTEALGGAITSPGAKADVSRADLLALATEKHALMEEVASVHWAVLDGIEPAKCAAWLLKPWTREQANSEFISRYHQLTGE